MVINEFGWFVMALSAVSGVAVLLSASMFATTQDTSPENILHCYHQGEVMLAVPSVESFRMKQSGMLLEVRWTNPVTSEQEIAATTLPCLYRVTSSPAGARPAD